jgi:Eco57I restriction-modification methylase
MRYSIDYQMIDFNPRNIKKGAQITAIYNEKGGMYATFHKRPQMGKKAERNLGNYTYQAMIEFGFEISPDAMFLISELFPDVNMDRKSVYLTITQWVTLFSVLEEKGIKLTQPDQSATSRKEIDFSIEPKPTPIFDQYQAKKNGISTDGGKINRKANTLYIRTLIGEKGTNRDLYTAEELQALRTYEGAGGQASEGEEILTRFFTHPYICEKMWRMAHFYGFKGGKVLEPSMGTGRFFENAPANATLVGIEPNVEAATIAKVLYPHATVLDQTIDGLPYYLEMAFLQPERFNSKYVSGKPANYPHTPNAVSWLGAFSLIISNPPYGKFSGEYASYFSTLKIAQIEHFFLFKCLDLLEVGGLLIFLIPSNFMRNGLMYQALKAKMFEKAELVDCRRLPNGKDVFENTEVGGDIWVLRRK